ncbi:H1FOO protein, partial [Crocuta crocuta]
QISWCMGSSPASGSVLTAQSLEPVSDSVSPSLSASPPLMLCLSLGEDVDGDEEGVLGVVQAQPPHGPGELEDGVDELHLQACVVEVILAVGCTYTGMHRGLLVRPTNSKARGATGSFKLVPKHKRKVQPRKTSAMTATRRPGEAKEKGHKKPREAKKDTPNSGEVKKGPRKAREVMMGPTKPAKEKAPKKGSQTKDQEARLSEAKKASQQPDKATQALPSATGPRGKSKVTGRRSNQDGEAHGKMKAGSWSSKSMVPQDKNTAAPSAKKKENKVLKEVVARGATAGPRAKAAALPGAGGSKTVSAPLVRRTEAPKGPRRPGMPTKASSSKLASKKTEA